MISKKNLLLGINIILSLIIIVLIIIILSDKKEVKSTIITHDQDDSFLLTNPILDCEIEDQSYSSLVFSKNISEKVEEIKDKYSLGHISLYFRDLNNGPWFGVNEKEVFSPASLLKVPLMIEFLHEVEDDPSILNKKIAILPTDINTSVSPNIKSEGSLVQGEEYTFEEILKSLIEKSDNTAVLALLRNVDKKGIEDVFRSIGVPFKDLSTEVDIRVKDYAGFFRVLFNSSYLSREMSEKALEILTKSEYQDGIVAGVPQEVRVAHKFGERNIIDEENSMQLHDCGIVYYPTKPYIICIMTKGNNFENQSKAIRDLSSYTYKEVDKNTK